MSRSILNILIYHTEILFTNTSKILHVYWRNVKRRSVQNILTCAMFSVCEYYHRHGKNSVVWMYFVKMSNNGNMNEPTALHVRIYTELNNGSVPSSSNYTATAKCINMLCDILHFRNAVHFVHSKNCLHPTREACSSHLSLSTAPYDHRRIWTTFHML